MRAARPPAGPRIVCKVGGSLLDAGRAPRLMAILGRTAPGLGILALAGGGGAADRIRARHLRGDLDLTKAHWAAVRVLDANAIRLAAAGGDGARVVTDPTEGGRENPREAGGGPAVLAPFPLLRAEDPLPHGWEVTSDSIAAWVAGRYGAGRLLLLKARGDRASPDSGDAPRPLAVERAAREGLVDRHLLGMLAGAPFRAWILNGRHPERLIDFLTGDATAGTVLRP